MIVFIIIVIINSYNSYFQEGLVSLSDIVWYVFEYFELFYDNIGVF